MKAYGLNRKEYENNSKKVGDLYNSNTGNAVYSAVGARNGLRHHKKAARRLNKAAITEGMDY